MTSFDQRITIEAAIDDADAKAATPPPPQELNLDFPGYKYDCPSRSQAQLDAMLTRFVTSKLSNGVKVPYSEIREDVRELNFEMNRRGLRPPAYRASRKVARMQPLSDDDAMLSEDRKVIDLDWLQCSGYREKLNDSKYADLMDDDNFTHEAAGAFAREKWKTEVRVGKIMNLTDVEQWQLAVLISEKERTRREDMALGARQFKQQLRSLSQRDATAQSRASAQTQLLSGLYCPFSTATLEGL